MKESTLPFMNMQATSSKSNPPDLDFEDTSTIRQTTRQVKPNFIRLDNDKVTSSSLPRTFESKILILKI